MSEGIMALSRTGIEGSSAKTNPSIAGVAVPATDVKPNFLDKIIHNNSAFARVCKWAGVISAIGGGAYGISHLPNAPKFNQIVPAISGNSLSASNNRSAVIKLNEHGLPWPENPTPATVVKDYSWEQEFKQPGSAKNLPYFGKATPAEIVDHINDVWNATKYVKHIPGQTVAQTWQRIKKEVDPVINSLGYTPTEAHKQIMYDAGIATFIATNVTYGSRNHSLPGLGKDAIISYAVNDEQSGIKHANSLLRQVDLRGVCADITTLDMALKNEAGILAAINDVYVRENPSEVVPYRPNDVVDAGNHLVVTTLYPNKAGSSHSNVERRNNMLGKFSRVLGDPTLFPLSTTEKSSIASITKFPRMSVFAVGGKGDDTFVVAFGAKNVSFKFFSDDNVYSRVVDLSKGGRFSHGKKLDSSFSELFDIVKSFDQAYSN
jgi:hypothetical protein